MLGGALRPSSRAPVYFLPAPISRARCSFHSSPRRLVLSRTPQSPPSSLPSTNLPSTVLPAVTSSSPPARGPTSSSSSDASTPILTAFDAAVAPLPCAYTPPEIAPLLNVKDVARAMEEIIVSSGEGEGEGRGEKEGKAEALAEVKGLDALVADVQAKEEGRSGAAVQRSAAS